MKVWTHSLEVLDGVAHRHPQTAYNGMQKSLQQEWYFVQRATPKIGEAFCLVEEALKKSFFLDLFNSALQKSCN